MDLGSPCRFLPLPPLNPKDLSSRPQMEPAKIDWKRIDSRFVEDVFYEHIRAPKWFDFLAPDPPHHHDAAAAWFCRPDCNHPKTAEDFLRTPPSSKLPSSGNANEILPLRDLKQRDTKLKRRGQTILPSVSNNVTNVHDEDGENQNPNLATTPSQQTKSWKAAFKSSSVKKITHEKPQNEELPRLKSTLSARNLFSGREILGHISEFCYELKKLATRVTEREDAGKSNAKENQLGETNEIPCVELEGKKERMPLLEVDKEKCEITDKGSTSSAKEKRRRKKRVDDAENIPICLHLENVKSKGDERLLQIRTNPPSPQCFSANRAPASKAVRFKPMERGILQELEQKEEEKPEERSRRSVSSLVEAKEGRGGLEVLWFLKPCTLAG